MNKGDGSLRVVNVTCIDLDPIAFILHFYTNFGLQISWFAVCMKQWLDHCPWLVLQYRRQCFAVIDSGEVGRSAVYSRYNNGPRTLPWITPALAEESSVNSYSTFTKKCLLCK
jgi:hypothetical protein